MKLHVKLLLVVLLMLFMYCGESRKVKHRGSIDRDFIPPPSNSKFIATDSVIGVLIESIESSDCVYGKYIGFVPSNSVTYARFESLKNIATDSLWLKLSCSKSAVMRVYAYQALYENHTFRSMVRERLIKDTTMICYWSVDVGTSCTVGDFVRGFKQ